MISMTIAVCWELEAIRTRTRICIAQVIHFDTGSIQSIHTVYPPSSKHVINANCNGQSFSVTNHHRLFVLQLYKPLECFQFRFSLTFRKETKRNRWLFLVTLYFSTFSFVHDFYHLCFITHVDVFIFRSLCIVSSGRATSSVHCLAI